MLGFALVADDAMVWHQAAFVWSARLTLAERGALAYAALRSLPDQDAETVAEAALGGGVGMPDVTVNRHMIEAKFWADQATPREHDAYALAAYQAMAPARQSAFLAHVAGGAGQ